MEEFKPNSHKSKEEARASQREKKVTQITKSPAKTKKQSDIKKFTDVFISEDMSSVKSYILVDVLVPAVKKAISDIVTNGIDMLLYGESGRGEKRSTASKVSYRSYYDKGNDRRDRAVSRPREGYSYDDIYLDNRGEAEDVLERMEEIQSVYGMVSVADLYDLVGVTGKYTDHKYGWTDLHSASVVRTRDGYKIKLPRAIPLD